jgi:hypothetical protein
MKLTRLPRIFPVASVSGLLALGSVALFGISSSSMDEAAPVPQTMPLDRYAALMEKSPFAVSTAVPEPAAPAESFASNWIVTGLSKSRGADGTPVYTAFIRSRDLSTRKVLSSDRPDEDGVTLVSVEEAAIATKAVVFVKKGSETAKVEFDQATVSASLATSSPGAPGAPPNASVRPSGAPQSPSVPSSSSAKPAANRSAIPRPGSSSIPRPSASTPGQPGAAPASTTPRRVRTVEEPPQ